MPTEAPPATTDRTATGPSFYDTYGPAVMFLVSLTFLVFLAGAIQLAQGRTMVPAETLLPWWGMALLYPVFVVEVVLLARSGRPRWRRYLWFCLLPPLRLAARDPDFGTRIWLPGWGWLECNRQHRKRLEDAFTAPMIGFALLILPLLAVEHFLDEQVAHHAWLAFGVAAGTSLVWLAFTFEFVVMASAAERKLDYCRRHWLNLLIILLPLVAFLRALRLAQLLRMQQLTRLTRLYRLRGLSIRFFRALVALSLVQRLLQGSPQKRLQRLRELAAEKAEELAELEREIAQLEANLSEPALDPAD